MAKKLETSIVETNTVSDVQIVGFSIEYVNPRITSTYLLLREDGTPYKSGNVTIVDPAEIATLMGEVQTRILAGESIDTASSEVAYDRVIASLQA